MPVSLTVHPWAGGPLRGRIQVPGDKSISHRAAIIAAIAGGDTLIHGFLDAADTRATLAVLRALGVAIEQDGDRVTVHGVGLRGLRAPSVPLDCGNSGTAMRLLTGLLAAQPFAATLVGDSSLTRRPMQRVASPLQSMGASVALSDVGTAPIRTGGVTPTLAAGGHTVTSAQVQGAILLAGLYADGPVSVASAAAMRDHTVRMLRAFGVQIDVRDNDVVITPPERLISPGELHVPGDLSAAAFHLVLASINPDAEIELPGVGINESRAGVLRLLGAMGASVELREQKNDLAEPTATLIARSASTESVEMRGDDVTSAMDEFPVLSVAMSASSGRSLIDGAVELRVKESDRIEVMGRGLTALGLQVEELAEGLAVTGGKISGGAVDAADDHRVAMAFAVAASVAESPLQIDGCGNIATSYPGFVADLRSLGLTVEEHRS
jgi:3-phosphoshikimate 1-carboxyvinyltransferase